MKSIAHILKVIAVMLTTGYQSFSQYSIELRFINELSEPTIGKLELYQNETKIREITKKTVFLFDVPKKGEYQIKYNAEGYQPINEFIQIDSASKRLSFTLTSIENTLTEVVVSGTLEEISIDESPVKIETINSSLFQKNPSPNLFQALNMVNGVKPQINCNVCNTGDIHINGMEGPYTMILIDGMPIVSGLSSVYGLMGIPNSIIERVEVMKGPAGALYGSEAMGGIINVITKNVNTAPKIYFDQQLSSWMESSTDLALSYKLTKHSNGLFSTNYFKYGNAVDNNKDGFTDLTLQDRISLFNKITFKRNNESVFHFGTRYIYEDRWGGQTNWNKTYRGSDEVYGESIYTNRLEILSSYKFPFKEKIQWQFSYNYHHQNSYYGINAFNALQQIGFSQMYWTKQFNEKHQLINGIAARSIIYDDNTVITLDENQNNKIDKRIIYGFFTQYSFQPNTNNHFLTGFRMDYDKQHGIIPSPRIAYKHDFKNKSSFRFNAGTGFRVVSIFTEDHMALTGARTVVFEEELKPEESINFNANYNKQWDFNYTTLKLDAQVFNTIFSNRIIADYDTDPRLVIYENLKGKATTQGASLNIECTNAWPLKINTGITYAEVYYETEENSVLIKKQQLFAPKWSGNFMMSYTYAKKLISIDVTGNWYGPQRLPIQPNDFRPEYSPWFMIMNLQLRKTYKSFEFYGGIKNILNFVPEHPIMRPEDPFNADALNTVTNPNGYTFDPSYNYASLQGRNFYLGIRIRKTN